MIVEVKGMTVSSELESCKNQHPWLFDSQATRLTPVSSRRVTSTPSAK